MTASLGLEPAPPPLIRAREAHHSNGLRIYASVGHGARRRHSASCRRPPCTGLHQRQRERLVHQGPRRPGVGCRHVQVAIPRRGGVAFPNHDVRIALTGDNNSFSALRGEAWPAALCTCRTASSRRPDRKFHEPSLQTARDSGPPHRQVFTLSAVQPSRELTRRSRRTPVGRRRRSAIAADAHRARVARAASWIRAGIRNVSRR